MACRTDMRCHNSWGADHLRDTFFANKVFFLSVLYAFYINNVYLCVEIKQK